ncbi:MAG: cell division protein ZapC [Vibrionaceae bacterium]
MLKPTDAWKWYFDPRLQSLMLDLGEEMVFRVAIEKKYLIPDAFASSSFSVVDATLFRKYWDSADKLELPIPRKAELALNAVAARRFHKPLLPKSWFFSSQLSPATPKVGDLAKIVTNGVSATVLLIENEGNASLCMLAQEQSLILSQEKTMHFCEPIKVMNDRLFIVSNSFSQHAVQKDAHASQLA